MNEENHIKELLLKFAHNSCTRYEIDELVRYFQRNPDEQVLPKVQELLQNSNHDNITAGNEADEIYAEIKEKIKQSQLIPSASTRKNITLWYAAVAAVFIGLLGIAIYFGSINNNLQPLQKPMVSENVILLEMDDGRREVLSEDGRFQITDKDGDVIGGQKGNQLVYQKKAQASREVVYNTLRIPYGKRFEIQLSDGSLVFMNAGSSLKYPVHFSKVGSRKVFLTGEAFFKVGKDKDRPFVVSADNLEIGVLGTEFNVSAYPEDQATSVVLVEGSVKLMSGENNSGNIVLKPGQLARLDQQKEAFEIREVDTHLYTAWMQGGLVFRNMSFENILKKMERHYDVKIINNDSTLAKEKFNASFGNEPIEKILEYFEKTYGLRFTQSHANTIIINPKLRL